MKNLSAEMVRYGVKNSDIQKLLGCTEKTVRNKISEETEFSLPEAIKIKNEFFKGFSLEYLFASDKDSKPAS